MKIYLTLSLIALFLNPSTHAWVENVGSGYPNCMACHISPTGGHILTDYGRALSSELMSTIKTKDFQNPFYGLAKNTDTLKWGGDIRAAQTRIENDQIKRGSSFLMQNNIEAAAYVKDFVFVATVGTTEGPSRVPNKGEFISERHYIMYQGDPTARVRVGKFRQNFGINDPNHTRFTKQDLGFGSYSETYQLEYFKAFSFGEGVLSTSLGRIDQPRNTREKNVMGQFTHYLGGKSRLGANVLLGESPSTRRAIYGINGVFGSKKHTLRFELDYQVSQNIASNPKGEKTHGLFGNIILGTRPFDGFFPYLVYEHKQTNLDQSRQSMTTAPGIGFQFFPISHVEVQFEHQYRTALATKDNPSHRSFLVVHLYH